MRESDTCYEEKKKVGRKIGKYQERVCSAASQRL
jgi:hypothetical protein